MNLFLKLMQKSVLGTHTEVTHGQKAHFLQDELAGKLQLEGGMAQKILQSQRRNLHDVTDVETVDPLALVQVAEDVLHI